MSDTPTPSLDDEMHEAVRAQLSHARASQSRVRVDWTREQWIADAEQQMDDLHGSVLDLLNGHVVAMLDEIRDLRARLGEVA